LVIKARQVQAFFGCNEVQADMIDEEAAVH
jgi:hypothetical protein